ncbi:hypothetical protein D3C73_847390 [compost metagenome]
MLDQEGGRGGRRGKQPHSGLAECIQQGAVIEFAHNARADIVFVKPLQQPQPNRRVFARQQERRLVQHLGKAARQLFQQGGRAKERQAAFAQQVAEAAHVQMARHRAVGNHHVVAVYRQVRQQKGQPPFTADQPHVLFQLQYRLDHPVHERFGYAFGNAQPEIQRLPRGAVTQIVQQFVAQGEDAVRVLQRSTADIREFKPPPHPPEQRRAQRGFQFLQLAADRLRRALQLLCRAGDAASLGDHPEIAQMFVVESDHGDHSKKSDYGFMLCELSEE